MRRIGLAGLSAVVVLLAMAPSVPAAPPARLSPAAQTLSQCVQTNHKLAVLMLIDESGSLRATDPLNQRVDGIRAAFTGLADLADTPVSGHKPQVSVLMAGFYGRVHPDPDTESAANAWRAVDSSTVDALNEEADQYAERNVGKATDYATALIAAHQLLVERAAELTRDGGAPPCEALIWFTDGRYSIPRRIGKAGEGLPPTVTYAPKLKLNREGAGLKAVTAGKSLMCRPAGLMDTIAGDGIVRFTVALSTQLSPEDAAFLDAATTGSAGAQRCGVDLSQRTGEYLTARDGDRLFFAFGDLLNPSTPITREEVCPHLACLRGTTTFKTVPGLSSFLIRASSGVEGAVLELKGPDGSSVRLRPDDPVRLSLSGASIVQRWVSSRAVEVEGSFDTASEAQWVGPWSYAFIDPSAAAGRKPGPHSYSSLQLFSDLEPTVIGDDTVIRGVPTKLKLGLATASGAAQVTEGPLVRGASVTATVSDPVTDTTRSVPVRADGHGEFTATISVPNSSSASLLYLGLTADLATSAGTPIAPQYRSFSLPVRLPPGQGYPILRPSALQLPSVQGAGTAEGTITVTGSPAGSGCVWIGAPHIEAPEDAGEVASSVAPGAGSAAHCLSVDKGETRRLTVRLTPSDEATGTVTASYPIHLHSDVVGDSRVTSVPVTFVLVKPPDNAKRVVLLVLLVLIGTLLPLVLLYLLNRQGARFTAPERLLVLAQDVTLSPAGVAAEVEPAFSAFKPLERDGGRRDARGMDIDLLSLRAVAARSFGDLFRGPYGVATARGGGRVSAGGSSGSLREWNGGTEREVPLSISGTWFFLPQEQPAPGEDAWGKDESLDADPWGDGVDLAEESTSSREGRLILLISRSGDVDLGRELLDDASQVLAETDFDESKDQDEEELLAGTTSSDLDDTSSEVDPWA